jgi:hypothetical protein
MDFARDGCTSMEGKGTESPHKLYYKYLIVKVVYIKNRNDNRYMAVLIEYAAQPDGRTG